MRFPSLAPLRPFLNGNIYSEMGKLETKEIKGLTCLAFSNNPEPETVALGILRHSVQFEALSHVGSPTGRCQGASYELQILSLR